MPEKNLKITGKKLAQFIENGAPLDYAGARRIINGQDKADKIADIARRFNQLLMAAAD